MKRLLNGFLVLFLCSAHSRTFPVNSSGYTTSSIDPLSALQKVDLFDNPAVAPASPEAIQAPVLKWQKGGCYGSWCETGWYSSPAAADLDGDGSVEVLAAAYTLFALNGGNGSLKWSVPAPAGGGGRVWPGVVLADLEADGDLEILTAHGGGYVRALSHTGSVLWTRRPVTQEFRSLSVGDLDGNGDLEIAVGRAYLNNLNVWVLEHNGDIRSGWPQLNGEGSAAGIYNDTLALGNLDGDPQLELAAPSDTITIAAYDPNGVQLPTNPLYHNHPSHDMDRWSEVPAYVDLPYEVQGWGPCYDQFTARANFAIGPANIVDVDGDGTNEVVAIGNVHNCHTSPYTDLYNTPYILNADRSRFQSGPYDWRTIPTNTGAPLSMDYNVIENIAPNPVTVDLDNDGVLEILFPSYDGRMHAFWLDKSEHGSWPYSVYNPAEGFYRFPGEPIVADLDNNGSPEVIFASWARKSSNQTGRLHILSALGAPLHTLTLPPAFGATSWNGALAAPTLANIDSDADLELILNTAHSGVVAYDLPGTSQARVLWGTGRGSYLRSGAVLFGSLQGSTKTVQPAQPSAGEILTYTITLQNPGPDLPAACLTDTLPSGVTYRGDLWASSGQYSYASGVITWTGSVAPGQPVSLTFSASLPASPLTPHLLKNTIQLDDGFGHVLERSASVVVNGLQSFFPLMKR